MIDELNQLNKEYDKLQNKYGDSSLDSIYNGGCIDNPDICFVFMNPTKRNIASKKTWKGLKSPWIGTKNIWSLFYKVHLISDDIFKQIRRRKGSEWDYDFASSVYEDVKNNRYFLTNLGKCTQVDARPLKNEVFEEYLSLLMKEISIIKPKVIILFGNQVSSIVLKENITVSSVRKKCFKKEIEGQAYKFYSVYYPIGNGVFNIDKAIEDILWIQKNEIHTNFKK